MPKMIEPQRDEIKLEVPANMRKRKPLRLIRKKSLNAIYSVRVFMFVRLFNFATGRFQVITKVLKCCPNWDGQQVRRWAKIKMVF